LIADLRLEGAGAEVAAGLDPRRRQLCAAAGNSDPVIIIQKRETVAWIPSGNITSTAERLSSILGIGITGVRKIALACFRRWLLREDAV